MKVHYSAISATLMANLLAIGFSGAAYAQDIEAPPAISFSVPNVFRCGANISWSQLTDWKGKRDKCGEGTLYTVIGEVPDLPYGYIKGSIVAPEDNNRNLEVYGGYKHPINNHQFEVGFCIDTREANRPIKIQAYKENNKPYGPPCKVQIQGGILQPQPTESLDMAKEVKYADHGRIDFIQDHRERNLVFWRSNGWIDADLSSQFDITQFPVLRIEYNAPYACSIYLELKNDSDQALIQSTRQSGISKYKVDLPPSKSRRVIDLSDYILPEVMNKKVQFIAFSDPTGDVTITSLKFTKRTEDFSIPVYRP